MTATGLLLAAGQGRRMGGPKALLRTEAGGPTLLERGLRALHDGGCGEVLAVLGAGAEEAAAAVPTGVRVVTAARWREGLGASLRAGLAALADSDAEAALVLLVDLPDVGADVVARVLAAGSGDGRAALARAAYHGVPGHPVLLGRDHWDEVAVSASGDRGARDYLASRDVALVECGDLATGRDVDRR